MEKVVHLQDVSFKQGGKEILQSIQFEMNEGEHWAIIGLNGSGKTSLLNIIAAYNFPTEGNVSILGETFGETSLPELRKRIGFVSNSLERFSEFYENRAIEEVVASGKYSSFGLYEKVTDEAWQQVDELLDQFGLAPLKGQPLRRLSEGEKRRVLIARALMNEPDILILDEPCSGLDILAREQFLQSLTSVTERGCHIIYVTHHIEELVSDITHVMLLDSGKIVKQGKKEEVLTDESLSQTFHVPVHVRWENDRPFVSVKS